MTARRLLRIFVLRSNSYWPFSYLNQLPYRLAIRWFVNACGNFSAIRSVYLRHALIEGHWTPALSDIDLTVVTDKRLSDEAEFLFLKAFWQRIGKLRRIFPMYGEIEVLSEDHLVSWAKFGPEGQGCSSWELLSGEETIPSACIPRPARFSLEVFDCAFWFYLQQITDLHNGRSASKYLLLQDLLRVQRKIGRCLAVIDAGAAETLDEKDRSLDSTGVLLASLKRLENGLHSLNIPEEATPVAELRRNWLLGQARKRNQVRQPSSDLAGFTHWAGSVRAIHLDNRKRAYVILNNCDDSAENRQCIGEIRQYFAQQKTTAVIVTHNLFAYFVRYLKPYDYPYLQHCSSLAFGDDSLVRIGTPPRAALAHELLKETPLLLMFPRSQNFIQPHAGEDFSAYDVEYKLDRALALKVFLDCGLVKKSIPEMLAAYDAANSKQAEQLRSLRERIRQQGPDMELFVFFKGVLDDIHSALVAGDGWENSVLYLES